MNVMNGENIYFIYLLVIVVTALVVRYVLEKSNKRKNNE